MYQLVCVDGTICSKDYSSVEHWTPHAIVRQIRAEKSESCAILHRSMKLCMVVEGDSKINFRSGAKCALVLQDERLLAKLSAGDMIAK